MGRIVLAIVALFGLLAWLVVEDDKAMAAKEQAFMAECKAHRPEYDCRLQWETYEAARSAEANAAVAAGIAASRSVR